MLERRYSFESFFDFFLDFFRVGRARQHLQIFLVVFHSRFIVVFLLVGFSQQQTRLREVRTPLDGIQKTIDRGIDIAFVKVEHSYFDVLLRR